MINFVRKPQYGYEDLLEIIRLLRSEDGCPWDKAQTHQSIRRGLLEEAYEAAEAIDNDDPVLLKEELGDVLMQVVFHADIESDAGRFTIDDVCDGVVKKLLFRHPHVFGSQREDSPESVLVSWDKLKRQEKGQKTVADSMDSVARSLPGLWRAEKLQNKAASAGFEWPDVQGALDKLEEEVAELRRAVEEDGDVPEELGDVLLQIVFHARLAEKEGFFTMQDVVDGINEKMIRRHPFVFEKITVEETKKLLGDWETRKRLEKNRKYLLSGVSKDLPSLLLACIIQRKVGSHGLTEALEDGALSASCAEEIKAAIDGKGAVDKELSVGRFLFALDRVIHAEGVEPELALHRYARYVMDQLRAFEKGLFQRGKSLMDISPEEAQVLWQDFCRKTDTSVLP